MFDLIDDLDAAHWEDKGGPPGDYETNAEYASYEKLQIVFRHLSKDQQREIKYVTADEHGKNNKNVIVRGIKSPKVDPLKSVGHFRAILEELEPKEENKFLVKAILLDLDHCVYKG